MNRDYRDYPASIWDAIGDVDQGICCAALGGVVWDFVSHLTPAQLLAAMDSAALETLRAIRDILEDDTLEDPEHFTCRPAGCFLARIDRKAYS